MALPTGKSMTHRALIFAACAKGRSTIFNPSYARDCMTTAAVLEQLGVRLSYRHEQLDVTSPGKDHWQSPRIPLDFGNSGTTARLMLGLLASLSHISCTCQGDASLSVRPMGRVVQLLRKAGAHIEGKSDGEYLPMTITGKKLHPFRYQLKVASAQVKSALLLAAMNIDGKVEINMPAGSRTHTEQMLQQQGIDCRWYSESGQQQLSVCGPYTLYPQVWHIAADPSAAAFFVVLGLLLPRGMRIILPDVLADDNRLTFLRIIRAMGGEVQRKDSNMRMCELSVQGGAKLRATQVSATEIPAMIDEVPILAVLAMFAAGETVWQGVDELRTKESDRLAAVVELCCAAGREAEVQGDTLKICGNSNKPITPYTFDARGDHRLSMAAAVCGVFAAQPCLLKNATCVDISFPNFFAELHAVTQGE